MFDSINQTITINVTIRIKNNVIETNADKNRNSCKNFFTCLVSLHCISNNPGQTNPSVLFGLTPALHLPLRSGLLHIRDRTSILWLAYL